MSRKLYTVALIAVLSISAAGTANAQFNIVAGMNFGQLSDLEVDNIEGSFESATGWHAGINYYLNLGIVGIRPGLMYRQFGDVTLKDFEDLDVLQGAELTFIDVPIDVVFRLGIIPVVKPYILAGATFSFPSSGHEDLKDNLESYTTSAGAGLGITVSLLGVSVSPEVRYEFGVTKLLKEEVDGDAISNDPPSSFIARVGIGF